MNQNTEMRDKYISVLFSVYALSYLVSDLCYDINDALEEKYPQLYRHEVKSLCKQIVKFIEDFTYQSKKVQSKQHGISYMVDFGRYWSDTLKPDFDKLIYAMANEIGRYDVPDKNLFAKIIVTQMLACDSADFMKKKLSQFEGYQAHYVDGTYKISHVLKSLSTVNIAHHLTLLEDELLLRYLPDDFDILGGETIGTGLKIIYNKINDSDNWKQALNFAQTEADKHSKQKLDNSITRYSK